VGPFPPREPTAPSVAELAARRGGGGGDAPPPPPPPPTGGASPPSTGGVREVQRRLAAAAEAAAAGPSPTTAPGPSVAARAARLRDPPPGGEEGGADGDAATAPSSGVGIKETQRRLAAAATAGPAVGAPPRETIQERIERLRTAGERAAAEKAAARPTLATTVKRFEADGPADDVAALTAQIAAARMSDVERDTLYGRLARGDATAAANVRAALLRRTVVGGAAGSGLGAKAAGGGVWELLGRAKARHAGAEEAGKRRLGWDGVTRKAVAVLERELLAALAAWAAAPPPGGGGGGGGRPPPV